MVKKIWEPIEIKGMHIKNRIGFPPFLNMPRQADGTITDLTIRWFEERAKGGAGFIITGTFRAASLATPVNRERFAKLVKVMHSSDVRIGVQIGFGGPLGGQGPSPSPFPDADSAKLSQMDLMAGRILPIREVTVPEMHFMQDEYARGALALKEIGVDCVEIHCAHGGATMGCSTISPFYNRRTDEYGGSWENRLRFNVESIQKMRAAVGPDYPIFARIDGDELLGPRGITIENCCEFIVPALEKAGVDCFDVSQGSILHAPQGITIPLYYPRGCFIHLAAAVKRVTKKPVIGVGQIFDLDMAEKFLEEGKADIIWMGRQLTSDPETPKKYFEGRTEDIRECIGCLGGCGRPCTVNYDIQDEPIPLSHVKEAKRVLVVGGGVAGMEASRIAALRGHRVTLFEKAPELGGMVKVLGLNPLTGELGNYPRYLAGQMRKLKVDVRVCKEATAADVEELKPDVVILATGSADTVPELAQGNPGVVTFSDALRHPHAIGHRVIVWGVFGSEMAIHLAETGHDVALIARSAESSLGSDISPARRFWLLRKLTGLNLVRESPEAMRVTNPKMYFNTTVTEIGAGKVRIKDKDGWEETIPYDTIIPVQRFGERQVDESLHAAFQSKAPELYKIGDCKKVRGIKDAVWDANEVARKI